MSQRYLENKKRPNPKENQIEILRFFEFCQKFQQRAPGLGERCYWGYISMRIHLKSCLIFPRKVCNFTQWLKVGAYQSHCQGWCQGYMLKLQALMYMEENDRTGGPIRIYATGNLTSWKGCYTGLHYSTQLQGSAHPCEL